MPRHVRREASGQTKTIREIVVKITRTKAFVDNGGVIEKIELEYLRNRRSSQMTERYNAFLKELLQDGPMRSMFNI